jgi:hypothetical protein
MPDQKLKPLSRSKNTERLYDRLRGLKGRRCSKIEFGYGGEVLLHFGRPRNGGKDKAGQWIINTCGTDWLLFTPAGLLRSADEEEIREAGVRRLEKTSVQNIYVGVPNDVLMVDFSNGSTLRIAPMSHDDNYDNVPYWEVFTPDNLLIAVGPKHQWQARRSDKPMR